MGLLQTNRSAYQKIHRWVYRHFGKPQQCDHCRTTTAGRYEWHNKSHTYTTERDDWEQLCASCHRRAELARPEHPWYAKKRKPGDPPPNKYLAPKVCEQCHQHFQPHENRDKYCNQACYWAALRARPSDHIRTLRRRSVYRGAKPGAKVGSVPWNKRRTEQACRTCGALFYPRKATSAFCCARCYWQSLEQQPPWNKGRRKT